MRGTYGQAKRPAGTAAFVRALVFFAILAALVACGESETPQASGLTGWEQNGEYDQRYDPQELDRVKGSFQEIVELTPLDGMAPGIGVIMRDRADDELVTVHLGPKAFVGKQLEEFGLTAGQKIKVTGVWAEFDGKDVFMASKIKKGEFQQVKVRRTSDGTPYWSMSPEQLAAERASEFEDDGEG
ncbi:hypothetical protein [Desulfocurvibacter africanus]|uniref:Magnetosome protein MamS/MamX domain-containing protein n=1 Tax=Desulfocurvibacter africanus subsp. africanus str. Walvis Bay TaxID=690850 RepID=F3YW87_DESAF|nr:hypothetical protein [Desulfocurvibacter africanus]EGJ49190.1 hypothetical protein Desaf_0839 [Desulfocurvibacter africanus subsp. africanus str. Walvis Bay]